MIYVPDKFMLVATPRTGSRSLKEMIRLSFGESRETEQHHPHPEDLKEEFPRELDELPVYSLLRNPYEQTLSWFHHVVVRHSPEKETPEEFIRFITTGSISWFFQDYLNPYFSLVTRLLLFDDGHLHNFERMAGREYEGQELIIGQSTMNQLDDEMITPRAKQLIEQRFEQDVYLWQAIN